MISGRLLKVVARLHELNIFHLSERPAWLGCIIYDSHFSVAVSLK